MGRKSWSGGSRRALAGVLLGLAIALAGSSGAWAGHDAGEALDDALQDLPGALRSLPPSVKTVSVNLLFTDLTLQAQEGNLYDLVVQRFVESGRVKVIDREGLGSILKEHALSMAGITEDRAALVRVGKLAGADAIAIVAASSEGNAVTVTVKMVEVESSAVVWQKILRGESTASGNTSLGAGFAAAPVALRLDFSRAASAGAWTAGTPTALEPAAIEPSPSRFGAALAVTHRQPFRQTRRFGFQADLAVSGFLEPECARLETRDSSGGRVDLSACPGAAFQGSVGVALYLRTRKLFGSRVDRFYPYAGVSVGWSVLSVRRGAYRLSTGSEVSLRDPGAALPRAYLARAGIDLVVTESLSLAVEAALAFEEESVRREGEYALQSVESGRPRVQVLLRF